MELNNLTVKEALLRTEARAAPQVCERDGQRVNCLQLLHPSKVNLLPKHCSTKPCVHETEREVSGSTGYLPPRAMLC